MTLDETVIHACGIDAGLSCDGDSVALTSATQPSIEKLHLGHCPDCRRLQSTGRSSTTSADR